MTEIIFFLRSDIVHVLPLPVPPPQGPFPSRGTTAVDIMRAVAAKAEPELPATLPGGTAVRDALLDLLRPEAGDRAAASSIVPALQNYRASLLAQAQAPAAHQESQEQLLAAMSNLVLGNSAVCGDAVKSRFVRLSSRRANVQPGGGGAAQSNVGQPKSNFSVWEIATH